MKRKMQERTRFKKIEEAGVEFNVFLEDIRAAVYNAYNWANTCKRLNYLTEDQYKIFEELIEDAVLRGKH